MSQWNQAPTRIQAPPRTDSIAVLRDYIAKLTDIVAIISKDLDFIINGNLDANNIRANSIETKNLKAGAVTADKIDVNELSAISANLGHITAGLIEAVQIYGSLISTNRYGYPRSEMSNTNNLFGSYLSPDNGVEIKPSGWNNVPAVAFSRSGVGLEALISFPVNLTIDSPTGVTINAQQNSINLRTQGFGTYVNVDNWSKLRNDDIGQTMQQALDALQTSIGALWTYTAGLESRIAALGG